MIHICQGAKTPKHQAMVYDTFFKDVYICTIKQRHISDEYFDELGYQKDQDATGKVVE
jgi:hypothetical protein